MTGELDMCIAWNGRIYDAQLEGAPIKICWECGQVLSAGSWGIPKGLQEQDPDKFRLAQLVLAWLTFPEINVKVAHVISYGPIHKDAIPWLERAEFDTVRDHLPNSQKNLVYGIPEDERWTAQHIADWQQRWNEFMQRD